VGGRNCRRRDNAKLLEAPVLIIECQVRDVQQSFDGQ